MKSSPPYGDVSTAWAFIRPVPFALRSFLHQELDNLMGKSTAISGGNVCQGHGPKSQPAPVDPNELRWGKTARDHH